MTCDERQELVAWRDGALSPSRAAEVAAHVAACTPCAAEAATLERGLAALASLPEVPKPSPALRARVLAAVTPVEPSAWARLAAWLRAGLRPVVLVPALSAAAALLLLAPRVQPAPLTPDEVSSALEAAGEPAQLEAALVLDELEQLETLGLDSPEDAEVVAMLDELEGRP
jgi:anti-sigma factor RsiW